MEITKRGELSIARAEAESPIPAAGGWEGDQIDQANADAEAELQIHLHQTKAATPSNRGRARSDQTWSFGTYEACQNPISRARLEAVLWARLWRDCKERQHG